jgi:hypothetical protein
LSEKYHNKKIRAAVDRMGTAISGLVRKVTLAIASREIKRISFNKPIR